MPQIEKRAIAEIRASANRDIQGTAIVFDKESQLLGGWFTEIIKPHAVTTEMLNSSDILMLFNHQDNAIPLARRKQGTGSLSVTVNTKGVDFSFKAKQTNSGEEALQAVRSGDIDGCSFAFRVAQDGDEWQSKPDGTYLRIIHKIEEIRDLSLVNEPAYLDTSCRSLKEEFEKRNKGANNLDEYYRNLDNELNESSMSDDLRDYYRDLDEEADDLLYGPELRQMERFIEDSLNEQRQMSIDLTNNLDDYYNDLEIEADRLEI